MKKIYFILCIFLLTFWIFSINTFAESTSENGTKEIINTDELIEIIDDKTGNFIRDNDIDISDYNWVNSLTSESFIKYFFNILKDGIKTPVKAGISIIMIIIILSGFGTFQKKNELTNVLVTVASLLVAIIVSTDVLSTVNASVTAINYVCTFMLSFLPIFFSVVLLSGNVITNTYSSGLLLFFVNCISQFASKSVMSLMGGYLSLGLMSSISPLDILTNVSKAIKKIAIWGFSLVLTVFVGVLNLQTTVNSTADSLAIKTTKFVVGTCVPIAGSALAEASGTLYSSMSLLKSSVGAFGIVAIAIAFVPILFELFIWKGVLLFCNTVSNSFSQDKISNLIDAVSSLFSVMISIVLFIGSLFIISLSIIVSAGKG